MRAAILALLIVMSTGAYTQVLSSPLYNHTIIVNVHTYAILGRVVDDLRENLQKGTGVKFDVLQDDTATGGIHLFILNTNDSTSPALHHIKAGDANEVWLQSDGLSSLNMYSYTRQGLINGIYTYLDTLGFKWYAPGDAWTITPVLKDIRLKWDVVLKPDFELRTFFGSFGVPHNIFIDDNHVVSDKWQQWYTRNRLGGGFTLHGHSGNEFQTDNRAILLQHPEYLSEIDGKRSEPGTAVKICISNTDAQKLYVEWMVGRLKRDMMAHPHDDVYCESAEPSDGGGDCTCDACLKMGSVSDRVFFLANLVAKAYSDITPRAYVNLYAYNTHASPPTFALQPNVIVQIIPYGYQSYASPEDMISSWQQKSQNLFIYDYYGMPIQNLDRPLKGNMVPKALADKIKLWQKLGIKGITLESSYSIGATGLGLYLFSRLSWNSHQSTDALIKEYYTKCYGAFAPVMINVQNTLASDTGEYILQLVKAMHILHDGTIKYNHLPDDIKQRVILNEAYLHYLKLLGDFTHDYTSAEMLNTSDTLMTFIYSTFLTMMVHPFPVSEYLKDNNTIKDYILKNWDYAKSSKGMKFQNIIHQWSNAQIDSAFNNDCRDWPELHFEQHKATTVPLSAFPYNKDSEREYLPITLHNQASFVIHTDATGQYTFKVHEQLKKDETNAITFTCLLNGKEALHQSININKDTTPAILQLQPNTTYTVNSYCNLALELLIPYNNYFVSGTPAFSDYPQLKQVYVYVPASVKELYISAGNNSYMNITSDLKTPANIKKVYCNIYKITFDNMAHAQVIALHTHYYNQLQFLNMPAQYVLRNDISVK